MQYDIFISYRREGGDMLAHILYERLTEKGYTVFQDIEVLRSGKFNTELYEKIKSSKDILLILPPHALDRCENKSDWLRQEIECALENGKNIVPIMLRGFTWPETLPPSLEDVRYFNGLTASTEYFENFLDKIPEYLTSKPRKAQPKTAALPNHAALLVGVLGVALFVAAMPALFWITGQPFTLFWRILYFIGLILLFRGMVYEITTRPAIARACFGTITEEDLLETPDVLFSRVSGVFGKGLLISCKAEKPFTKLYRLRRLIFGTWDDKCINYLRIQFKRTPELYDPSVFYLNVQSRGSAAVKMLTRQGFILQTVPDVTTAGDYLTKGDLHVFLFYKKRKLDSVEIFQCPQQKLTTNYSCIKELISHEK